MGTPEPDADQLTEEKAASHLSQGWAWCNLPAPEYPIGTNDVVDFCRRLGYRVDPDFLCGLIERNRLDVPIVDGQHQWSALSIVTLHFDLEARRRWLLHPHHLAKLTMIERDQLVAELAGHDTCFEDDAKFDTETLLLALEHEADPKARHLFRVALQARLRAQGAL